MTHNEKDWELLNGFADGELDEAVCLEIERRLNEEPELVEMFERIQTAKSALLSLQEPIEQPVPQAANPSPVKKSGWKNFAAAAGMALMVMGVTGYYYLETNKNWAEVALDDHYELAQKSYVIEVPKVQSVAWGTPEIGILAPDLTGARLYLVDMKMTNSRSRNQVSMHYRGLRGCSLTIFATKLKPGKEREPLYSVSDVMMKTWSDKGFEFAAITKGMDANRFNSIVFYSQEMISHQLHKGDDQYARFVNKTNIPCA